VIILSHRFQKLLERINEVSGNEKIIPGMTHGSKGFPQRTILDTYVDGEEFAAHVYLQ
jgi:hypothetical protein